MIFSKLICSTKAIYIVGVPEENIRPNSDKCVMLIAVDDVLAFL